MLELWEMQRNPLLLSLSGPLWLKVIGLDRVLYMCQIELCTYTKMNCFK